MPFLIGIVGCLDASGVRLDTPDVNGNFLPILLKLGTGITGAASNELDGLTTITLTSSGGGGGGSGIALDTIDDLRAATGASVADGAVNHVGSPARGFVYQATFGAGVPDDTVRIIKPNAKSTDQAGRHVAIDSTMIVVNTMADMMALPGPFWAGIRTKGFYAPGDGGDNEYFMDLSDTTSADNVGVVRVLGGIRYKRAHGSNWIHAHAFGMKPNDTAFNNAAIFNAAMVVCAGKLRLQLGLGRYRFWQIVLPATLGAQFSTVNVTVPSDLKLSGVGRGLTVLEMGTPVLNGDPTNPAQTPMIPITLTAMLRSTHYAAGTYRYVNGHSYFASNTGDTSANPSDAPSGIFDGTHLDGTIQWSFADQPYRGGAFIQVANGAKNTQITDLTIDGLAAWVDNTTPPAYTSLYLLYNGQPLPLMYAESSYRQVTFGYGWDVFHKGLAIGQIASAANGVVNLLLRGVEITRFRGELVYGGGYDLNDPHNTVFFENSELSETPACFSDYVGAHFFKTRFRHAEMAFDVSRGLADQSVHRCVIEDVRQGYTCEGNLLDQSQPGQTHIHHNVWRNVYRTVLNWGPSFSANPAFTSPRALMFEHNDIYDSAWDIGSGGTIFQVGGGSVATPDRVLTKGVTIQKNNVHIGAMTAPARTGGATATGCFAGFNFSGAVADFEFDDNWFLVEESAVTAGRHYQHAGYWQVFAGSRDCFVRRNRFRGAGGGTGAPQGIFLIDTTSDQFLGFWKDNILLIDGATQEWPISSGGFNPYTNGQNVFPKLPVWYARGAGGAVLTTAAGITHPERWAPGQIIELRCDDEGSPLLIPQSSATHDLPAPRILTPRTRLRLRRGSTSNSTDTPHWYEDDYFAAGELVADAIGPLAPPNPTIESYAPGIQFWGVHIVHLLSGTYNYFTNAPDEDGMRVQVYCKSGTVLHHNSGVAPAGTANFPKMLLIGGVNFTFAHDGEAHFIVDNDTGIAAEVFRLPGDGTVITAQGITATDTTIVVTGGGAIAATGDFNTTPKTVLAPLYRIGVDDVRSPTWNATAFSFGGALVSNGATCAMSGQSARTTTNGNGGLLLCLGGSADGTGIPGAVAMTLGDAAGLANQHGVSCQALANTGRRSVGMALFANFGVVTTTNMPVNTGDCVVAFFDAQTEPSANPGPGLGILSGASGHISCRSADGVITDYSARGPAVAGSARFQGDRQFKGQAQTVGTTTTNGLFSVNLAAAGFGDGTYEFEFHVMLNDTTNSVSGLIICSGGWQNRGGTVSGVQFPTIVGADAALGGSLTAAKLAATISGTTIRIDAQPNAGSAGKNIDWTGKVFVRRASFT